MSKIMSKGGGVGESKVFRNPEAPEPDILTCHFNGELVADMLASGKIQSAQGLLYATTDEGLAERVGKIMAGGGSFASGRVTVGQEAIEKVAYDKLTDDLEDDDLWMQAESPYETLRKEHTPPGYQSTWLGDESRKRIGDSGYKQLIKEGEPIRCMDATLGIKTQAEYDKWHRRLAHVTAQTEKEIAPGFEEKVEQGYREAGKIRPRQRPNDPDVGVQDDRAFDLAALERA